ncbi:MAG TPA: hypothetical protein VE964_17955 [Myxococcales bacterium]|nr:hypothetical protein [Myxococcales bacterium]
MRILVAIVALCGAAVVAAEKNAPAGREEARRVLQERGCGKCHDTAVSTQNPQALAVYDLHEVDWPAKMSDERLPKLMGRLKSAPAADRKIVKDFIQAELAARKQEPPPASARGGTRGSLRP